MFTTTTQLRVRYGETDQMGIVYYGNYATYLEVARVEAMRVLGLSYKAMEDSGIMMPVLELKCKYIRPARYDDLITIKVSIPVMPSTRILFEYEIYNEQDTLLHKAETTLVFVDMEKNKPCPAPAMLAQPLAKYFPAA